MVNKLLKHLIISIIGGITYIFIEILWRGYSHWTMFAVGAILFFLVGNINSYYPWSMPLWKQMGIATIIVTIVEFISGCIINIWLGWNVWNYTEFDILGQICFPYCFLWFWLSLVGIMLDDILRWKLFSEGKPRYKVF